VELLGIPFEFFLFAATLLGVALFHHYVLPIALGGLDTIASYKILFSPFRTGVGLAGFVSHLGHEWVLLANLFSLLVGFALLARHFEESGVPELLPRLLPSGWLGPFVPLILIFILSGFLDNIAAALIGATVAATLFRRRVHIGYLAAIVAASNAGGAGSANSPPKGPTSRLIMRTSPLSWALFLFLTPNLAHAAGSGVVGENLLWLALILMSARLFTPLAARLGFPAVLGELLLGVLLGNLSLFGLSLFESIRHDPIIKFLAELGVIVLLLQIGLETRLADLVQVGGRATAVGIIGIITPFVLGAFLVGPWLLPELSWNTYLFLGAALSATSVGITGRVFRDLGKLNLPAARIVLGAAVIDDVLGLVILAVVTSLVQVGTVAISDLVLIVSKAVLFLAGSIGLGRLIAPYSARWLAQLDAGPSMLFAQVLSTGLAFAWLAHLLGLAPIIGAFAAGLLFEPLYLKDFEKPHIVQEIEPLLANTPRNDGLVQALQRILNAHTGRQHEHMLEPIGYFFVPVFFVLTGMQVKLDTLTDPQVVAVALAVTAAAIVGKLAAGLAAGSAGRWIVGWGMVPRGEVGLIFAMVGQQLGVISEATLSVIVIMVILTTLLTPPTLSWLLRKKDDRLSCPPTGDRGDATQ